MNAEVDQESHGLHWFDSDGEPWLDAMAGRVSPTGHGNEAIQQRLSTLNAARLATAQDPTIQSIETYLSLLISGTQPQLTKCLVAGSTEQAIQWMIVLGRRHHAAKHTEEETENGNDKSAIPRCLGLVGSDHGRGVVSRMASGLADLRDSAWPVLPGFAHATSDNLISRVDASSFMVLVSPVACNDMARSIDRDWLSDVREACDGQGALLVLDHSQLPPNQLSPDGSTGFWAHSALHSVRADAVLMSTGLTGGMPGSLLLLTESLHNLADEEMEYHPIVSELVDASLANIAEVSELADDPETFAIALAEAIATRESVRDLHATGSTIGMELDVPSRTWIDAAQSLKLRVFAAGPYAVGFQLPMLISEAEQSELLERIDEVFDQVEAQTLDESLAKESVGVPVPADDSLSDDDSTEESETDAELAENSIVEETDDVGLDESGDSDNVADEDELESTARQETSP